MNIPKKEHQYLQDFVEHKKWEYNKRGTIENYLLKIAAIMIYLKFPNLFPKKCIHNLSRLMAEFKPIGLTDQEYFNYLRICYELIRSGLYSDVFALKEIIATMSTSFGMRARWEAVKYMKTIIIPDIKASRLRKKRSKKDYMQRYVQQL